MDREFTRKQLYDLVWSQPMRTVAISIGISDVALAKHCKKASIPVPSRGYWARKHAGKSTVQVALTPRFPGASDRVCEKERRHYYGGDWPEKFLELTVPPVPMFDEELSAVEERARKLVGQVRWFNKFDPVHPQVAKLLAHDDERRERFRKWGSSYDAPRYEAGLERRRLLAVNSLFIAAARLGCRPSISTSKYGQDSADGRDISIKIGVPYIHFTIEPAKSTKEGQNERLRLAFGLARQRSTATKFWEDSEKGRLESQLTDVLVNMLVSAEVFYRDSLVSHREWVIERQAEAAVELKKRADEAERKLRELQEKLRREQIGRLLSQAKALDRAMRIRNYVDTALMRAAEMSIAQADLEEWAMWARLQANSIDPVENGTLARAVKEHSDRVIDAKPSSNLP